MDPHHNHSSHHHPSDPYRSSHNHHNHHNSSSHHNPWDNHNHHSNRWESNTVITANTSAHSTSIDVDLNHIGLKNSGGGEHENMGSSGGGSGSSSGLSREERISLRCQMYSGVVVAVVISLCAFFSPILMIMLAAFGDPNDWKVSECGNAECDGLFISISFKMLLLLTGTWLLFARKPRANMPRVFIYRAVILALIFLLVVSYWLFFVVRATERRFADIEIPFHSLLSSYPIPLIENLLWVHYLAVILIEIRQRQKKFFVKIIRSPDGQSKSFTMGQLSIQRAAVLILEKYYSEFGIFNPHLDSVPSRKRSKPSGNSIGRSEGTGVINSHQHQSSTGLPNLNHMNENGGFTNPALKYYDSAADSDTHSNNRITTTGGNNPETSTPNHISSSTHHNNSSSAKTHIINNPMVTGITGGGSNTNGNSSSGLFPSSSSGGPNDDRSGGVAGYSSIGSIRSSLTPQESTPGNQMMMSSLTGSTNTNGGRHHNHHHHNHHHHSTAHSVVSIRTEGGREWSSSSRHRRSGGRGSSYHNHQNNRSSHHNHHNEKNSERDKIHQEYEYERKVKKRKIRLIGSAEEAFTHIKLVDEEPGAAISMDPLETAQAIFPSMARPLQKYLRVTRQQNRHTLQSILEYLSVAMKYGLSAKAFLEKYLNPTPVLNSDQERSRKIQTWGLVCDLLVSRPVDDGVTFMLRQGEVSLLVTFYSLPYFNLQEEIIDPKVNRFVFRLNSETSV